MRKLRRILGSIWHLTDYQNNIVENNTKIDLLERKAKDLEEKINNLEERIDTVAFVLQSNAEDSQKISELYELVFEKVAE